MFTITFEDGNAIVKQCFDRNVIIRKSVSLENAQVNCIRGDAQGWNSFEKKGKKLRRKIEGVIERKK